VRSEEWREKQGLEEKGLSCGGLDWTGLGGACLPETLIQLSVSIFSARNSHGVPDYTLYILH
jgi:hypothetical protein